MLLLNEIYYIILNINVVIFAYFNQISLLEKIKTNVTPGHNIFNSTLMR